MKAKIYYVGGNTYTLGGVQDYNVSQSLNEVSINTVNQRDGCVVESTVHLDMSDVYYIEITGSDGSVFVVPGVMKKFVVSPALEEVKRVGSAEKLEKDVAESRARKKEQNRKKLAKKRALRYIDKK